jgi:8-oxo-dGTP pyrophosphatase MutT (NUDIX family)
MNEDEKPQKPQSYLDILLNGRRDTNIEYKYIDKKKLQLFCNNCGKLGHHFKCCTHPVTSLGIICFKLFPKNEIKYLYILRRHTYSYVELVRSKFFLPDDYIKLLINGLTFEEKNVLLHLDFDTIWGQLWTVKDKGPYIKDYESSKESYLSRIDKIKHYLDEIELTNYEPEWGFPKGRRNYKEDDITCAIREFKEETQLTDIDFKIIKFNNYEFFVEEYKAINNNVKYKHIYYPAIMITEQEPYIDPLNLEQVGEVKKIQWKSLEEIKNITKEENKTRIEIIEKIEMLIKNKYYFDELIDKEV